MLLLLILLAKLFRAKFIYDILFAFGTVPYLILIEKRPKKTVVKQHLGFNQLFIPSFIDLNNSSELFLPLRSINYELKPFTFKYTIKDVPRNLSYSKNVWDLPCSGPIVWDRHEPLYTSTATVSNNYNILHLQVTIPIRI